ncbi:hypothetical protein JCM19232_4635 [Vibrio ishigakensis]|uniref:Sulphur transport domain-containing protein n=1 Tax=Vibrio ishigakensis TaxID=1481914 RepID=A0A0B8PIU7_9VIBR|nr:hypothetical protein JCM19232_4635 [Vibrio ishigakensis]
MLMTLAFVSIFILGYLAQTSGLCMVRGVKELTAGKPLFLIAIFFSGSFAWLPLLVAQISGHGFASSSLMPTYLTLVGGLLFGMGAAFNGGCGVSTISRLTRGHVSMLATVVGWLTSWFLLYELYTFSVVREEIEISSFVVFTGLGLLSITLLILVVRYEHEDKNKCLMILGIGVMAGLVFVFEHGWTPSSILKDASLSTWTDNGDVTFPALHRFILIALLALGMVAAAVITKTFSFDSPNVIEIGKHYLAGILMGFGAAMAGGGNDSQLLVALPSFSLSGLVAVVAIIFGIWFGLKLKSLKRSAS